MEIIKFVSDRGLLLWIEMSIFCCRVEMKKGFVIYASSLDFMDLTIFPLSASAVIKITGIFLKLSSFLT